LRERGFTILMVEQNFRFASRPADRFYVIEEGSSIETFAASAVVTERERIEAMLGI
jgi:branched-chain amino acid transport system ATP-binding protein